MFGFLTAVCFIWLTPLPCTVSLPVNSSDQAVSIKDLLPGFKKFIFPTEIVLWESFIAVPTANLVLGRTLHSKLAYITKFSCLTNLSLTLPSWSIVLFGSIRLILS